MSYEFIYATDTLVGSTEDEEECAETGWLEVRSGLNFKIYQNVPEEMF